MKFPDFSSDGIKGGQILCGASINHALKHVRPHKHTPFCASWCKCIMVPFSSPNPSPRPPWAEPSVPNAVPEQNLTPEVLSTAPRLRQSQALGTSQLELLSDRVYTSQKWVLDSTAPSEGILGRTHGWLETSWHPAWHLFSKWRCHFFPFCPVLVRIRSPDPSLPPEHVYKIVSVWDWWGRGWTESFRGAEADPASLDCPYNTDIPLFLSPLTKGFVKTSPSREPSADEEDKESSGLWRQGKYCRDFVGAFSFSLGKTQSLML